MKPHPASQGQRKVEDGSLQSHDKLGNAAGSQNPPREKCFGKSTSHTRVHRVNFTASSSKLKVNNFTPYYMQGVQKKQKIGNERLAGALSGTRELTDSISSVIYEISTNSFGRGTRQRSQPLKMALNKLKMLH